MLVVLQNQNGHLSSKFFIADGAGAPTTEESLQNFKISMLPGTHDIKNSTGVVTSDPHMPEKATITELGAESEKTLFLSNAASGSGGTWGSEWDSTLKVPSQSHREANHVATVTWQMLLVRQP